MVPRCLKMNIIVKVLSRIPLGKFIVCLAALIHLIFLYDGLHDTIAEEIDYERNEDLQNAEKTEAIFLYGLHSILIITLIYSVLKNSPKHLFPWLLVSFPFFVYMTFMVLKGLILEITNYYYYDIILINIIYVVVVWFLWSYLYLIFKTGHFQFSEIFSSSKHLNHIKRRNL